MRQALPPALALACVPAAALVAHLLDGSTWLAALGAALVLIYWALDWGVARLGMRGSFSQAIGVGLGGMLLRLVVVLGALALVGSLTSREETLACVAGFLGTFTVYFVARLAVMPFQLTPGGGSAPGGPPARNPRPDDTCAGDRVSRTAAGPRPARRRTAAAASRG